MASRLNTILVVLSVPTLLSAAVSIYWSRKRKPLSPDPATTSVTTTESTTDSTRESSTESSLPHSQSHQVRGENHISSGEEVTDSSSSTPAPVTEQPACDPAVINPDSRSEVQERVTEADNCDNSMMQISDGVNPTSEPPAAPVPDNRSVKPSNTTSPTSAMAGRLQRANSATSDGPTADLKDTKAEKGVIPKTKNKRQQQPDTGSKKSGSGKKEKMHSSPVDPKVKNVTSCQSPASDAQTPAAAGDLPDSRSRQTHDSGDSVGAVSLDSGTDVRSPASAADQKTSDRSVDSPSLFKSDASQGSPCNWGASDSHSEVIPDFLLTAINFVYRKRDPVTVGKAARLRVHPIRLCSSSCRV